MNRERPRIDNPDVGEKRHIMYKKAWERYNEAHDAKYFIECIAIVESLISDRLESLSNQITASSKFSYSTLDKLITYLCGKNQIQLLNDEIISVINKIKVWKNGRNRAIHEMAKLSEDLTETFDQKYGELEQIADNGRELFNELNNSIRKLRNKKKKTQTIYVKEE